MSGSSTGFGKRQGGLAQSYRSGLAARSRVSSSNTQPKYTPPKTIPPVAQSWTEMPEAMLSGGSSNISGLSHPVLMRWVSGFIDLFILTVLTIFTIFFFNAVGDAEASRLLEDGPLTWVVILLWFGYGLVFEGSAWQGTPGKKLTGLVITDMSGQKIGFGKAFGRACAKVFSGCLPLYIPYIMVGVTERKQSLHDKMCGTLVFRRHDLMHSNTVFD